MTVSVNKKRLILENEPNTSINCVTSSSSNSSWILWINGGSWRGYDWEIVNDDTSQFEWLAEEGFLVISASVLVKIEIDYYKALRVFKIIFEWLESNSNELNIDIRNGYIAGFSAGGNMAVIISNIYKKYIQGVLTFSTTSVMYDAEWESEEKDYVLDTEEFYDGVAIANDKINAKQKELNNESVRLLSCEFHLSKNSPPALIVHGTLDPLVSMNQSVRLYKQYKRMNGKATLLLVNGFGHGDKIVMRTKNLIKNFLKSGVAQNIKTYTDLSGKVLIKDADRITVYDKFINENSLNTIWFSTLRAWYDPVKPLLPVGTFKDSFYSKTLDTNIEYLIYLPKGYFADKASRYPTSYYLTPYIVNPRQFSRDIIPIRNAAMSEGEMVKTIIVVLNHDFYQSHDKKMSDKCITGKILTEELVPRVDSKYRTLNNAEFRVLEGECDSARIALTICSKYPKNFLNINLYCPRSDCALLKLLEEKKHQKCNPRISIEVGSNDPNIKSSRRLNEFFKKNMNNVRYREVFGAGHGSTSICLSDDFKGFE